MTQADWVKESSEILLSVMEDHTGDSESNFPDAESKLHKLISKVETLTQQRTEKKWREALKEDVSQLIRLGGIRHAEGIMEGWWVNYDEVVHLLDGGKLSDLLEE